MRFGSLALRLLYIWIMLTFMFNVSNRRDARDRVGARGDVHVPPGGRQRGAAGHRVAGTDYDSGARPQEGDLWRAAARGSGRMNVE